MLLYTAKKPSITENTIDLTSKVLYKINDRAIEIVDQLYPSGDFELEALRCSVDMECKFKKCKDESKIQPSLKGKFNLISLKVKDPNATFAKPKMDASISMKIKNKDVKISALPKYLTSVITCQAHTRLWDLAIGGNNNHNNLNDIDMSEVTGRYFNKSTRKLIDKYDTESTIYFMGGNDTINRRNAFRIGIDYTYLEEDGPLHRFGVCYIFKHDNLKTIMRVCTDRSADIAVMGEYRRLYAFFNINKTNEWIIALAISILLNRFMVMNLKYDTNKQLNAVLNFMYDDLNISVSLKISTTTEFSISIKQKNVSRQPVMVYNSKLEIPLVSEQEVTNAHAML